GFRIRDGSVAWRDRGSNYVCNLLPCPGAVEFVYASPQSARAPGASIGLRVRGRGTLTGTIGRVAFPIPSKGVQTALEGFDLATGRTLWQFKAGHFADLATFEHLPARLGATVRALPSADGRWHSVNLRNGASRRIGAASRGWCRSPIIWLQKTAHYVGQFTLFSCTVSQR